MVNGILQRMPFNLIGIALEMEKMQKKDPFVMILYYNGSKRIITAKQTTTR